MRQVCFRLPAGASVDAAPPLGLGDIAAQSLAELLQVLACGEESAALAFAALGRSVGGDVLARIAEEEAGHERLLRSLRARLPEPRRDPGLVRALVRFYGGLKAATPADHFAGIVALDSAVCVVLTALLGRGAPIAEEPTVASAFRRIRADEGRHVRAARAFALGLGPSGAAHETVMRVRRDLSGVLGLRAETFERLSVDPDRLFRRLNDPPPGLCR